MGKLLQDAYCLGAIPDYSIELFFQTLPTNEYTHSGVVTAVRTYSIGAETNFFLLNLIVPVTSSSSFAGCQRGPWVNSLARHGSRSQASYLRHRNTPQPLLIRVPIRFVLRNQAFEGALLCMESPIDELFVVADYCCKWPCKQEALHEMQQGLFMKCASTCPKV